MNNVLIFLNKIKEILESNKSIRTIELLCSYKILVISGINEIELWEELFPSSVDCERTTHYQEQNLYKSLLIEANIKQELLNTMIKCLKCDGLVISNYFENHLGVPFNRGPIKKKTLSLSNIDKIIEEAHYRTYQLPDLVW